AFLRKGRRMEGRGEGNRERNVMREERGNSLRKEEELTTDAGRGGEKEEKKSVCQWHRMPSLS
ncbi:hypothetical protein, partial [Streptococcus pyogenes]|uniref:hypothetical protein n=1 Tax=Streptococcus pyogenes TaxID=1314 RepID=UPI001652DE27